jgi:hypothetical protein
MAAKTIAEKLLIKPGSTVWASDPSRLALAAHADAAWHAPGAFWVLYPKGGRADINRDSLWPMLVEHGMRPISQVAVDDTWSALRFRALREGETFNP